MSSRTPEQKHSIRQRYLAVDTATVADVLDKLRIPDQGLSPAFAPYPATAGKLAGWVYTLRGQMTAYSGNGDPEKMAACQGLEADDVSVWSGDGEGVCYFGELIATGMKERGCVGALVDGGIRDVRWIGELGFPVYARYRTPVQSIGRWKVNAHQVPVMVRGATVQYVRVHPGDFVIADEDGAVIVPDEAVEKVLAEAERLTEVEQRMRAELRAGLSLAEALKKYGHV